MAWQGYTNTLSRRSFSTSFVRHLLYYLWWLSPSTAHRQRIGGPAKLESKQMCAVVRSAPVSSCSLFSSSIAPFILALCGRMSPHLLHLVAGWTSFATTLPFILLIALIGYLPLFALGSLSQPAADKPNRRVGDSGSFPVSTNSSMSAWIICSAGGTFGGRSPWSKAVVPLFLSFHAPNLLSHGKADDELSRHTITRFVYVHILFSLSPCYPCRLPPLSRPDNKIIRLSPHGWHVSVGLVMSACKFFALASTSYIWQLLLFQVYRHILGWVYLFKFT